MLLLRPFFFYYPTIVNYYCTFATTTTTTIRSCSSTISTTIASNNSMYYTYTLGSNNSNTIYVPITSYCNTNTLPMTRGPNFILPAQVLASLCRVRDAEMGMEQWKHWCQWLDSQDISLNLPVLDEKHFVTVIPNDDNNDNQCHHPTVDELIDEVMTYFKKNNNHATTIVIAGEGEPTLRFNALIEFIEKVDTTIFSSTLQSSEQDYKIRINTNGLLNEVCTEQLIQCCKNVKSTKVEFTVALMTHDKQQYNDLMNPLINNAHEIVQNFICKMITNNINVEITAIDRIDVNKELTNDFAKSLGIRNDNNIRWRSYFS